MKRREFLVGAALLAGTMARSRAADIPAPSSDGLDRITAYFDDEVTSGRLPGAVVLVQQHGKPVYLKNFGVRDTRTGLAMTPDTIFAIHSMTKPITCLGAMMLIDEGKLALTDPVSKYIPALRRHQGGHRDHQARWPDDARTRAAGPPRQHRGSAAAHLGHQLRLYRRPMGRWRLI